MLPLPRTVGGASAGRHAESPHELGLGGLADDAAAEQMIVVEEEDCSPIIDAIGIGDTTVDIRDVGVSERELCPEGGADLTAAR
jgi:hypothetical protein